MTRSDSTPGADPNWQLLCLDRVLFTGHLPIDTPGGLVAFLHERGIRLEDWPALAKRQSDDLVRFAARLATAHGRPFRFVRDRRRKDRLIDDIVRTDPVEEGLIAVLYAVEPCRTFRLSRTRQGTLRLDRVPRKCRQLYFYWQDREFGRLFVRVQTWYPFPTQICWNGHEWLACALAKAGIGHTKQDNALVEIADPRAAQAVADRLFRRKWVRVLTAFARRCNPLLRGFLAGFHPYWVADQTEVSLDLCYPEQNTLDRLEDDIMPRALYTFSPEDLARIVGKRRPAGFRGAIKSDYRQRRGGFRIKHWVATNVLKAYRKGPRLLRLEFTFNKAADFKVRRRAHRGGRRAVRVYCLRKGLADFFRYRRIAHGILTRYFDALQHIAAPPQPLRELARLARRTARHNRRYRALNPLASDDYALIRALLNGEQMVRGLRNAEIRRQLFGSDPRDGTITRARAAHVTRLLALARAHGLIARVPRTHRWRLSAEGLRLLPTVTQLTGGIRPRLLAA